MSLYGSEMAIGIQSALDASPTPRRRSDVRVREIDLEALVYDPVSGDTHCLNETALFIWRHLTGEYGPPQLADRLAEAYDVDRSTAMPAVENLLEDLQARGLMA